MKLKFSALLHFKKHDKGQRQVKGTNEKVVKNMRHEKYKYRLF